MRSPSPDPTATAAPPGRLRARLLAAATRVTRALPSLLVAAGAAGAAYAIASLVFDSLNAVFAPIAAVITVGLTADQQIRRAVEIAVGVALGLAATDLLSRLVGAGPLQLALFVLLAMALAVTVGGGTLAANQAAVAAILVVGFGPTEGWSPVSRLGDALIGGAVGLVAYLLLGPDRSRYAWRAAEAALTLLAESLEVSARSLRDGERPDTAQAMRTFAAVRAPIADLEQEISGLRTRARWGRRRRALRRAGPLLELATPLTAIAATTLGLARASSNAMRHAAPVPEDVTRGVSRLADAVRALPLTLRGVPEAPDAVEAALDAARHAAAVPRSARSATASALIAQIRSGAVDVLRATGLPHDEAIARLEAAAGRADADSDA
jgi:hypothetical protein